MPKADFGQDVRFGEKSAASVRRLIYFPCPGTPWLIMELSPLGIGLMFQTLLKRRATGRAYKRIVADCLTVLFCGFPHGLLPSLRHRIDISGLVRQGQAEGTDPRACSMQGAVLVIRKIIGPLSKQERQELAQAFLQNDAGNPTYKGFKYMFQVAEQLNVSPALFSYLTTEVAGQLRGMSQEAIFNSWVEAQVGGVMGQLRERSKNSGDPGSLS